MLYFVLIINILFTLGACEFPRHSGNENEGETIQAGELVVALKPAFLVLNLEDGQDIILGSFRNAELQGEVIAFFQDMTGSADVAEIILKNASALDISPALAFALCKEESAYNPRAYHRNQNDTVDRGLFQLNSASFPKLSGEDFYDPGINAWHGLSHLRWCLDTAGTEVAGLAMYNAGVNRVRSAGTPKRTLDYISRILKNQRLIEELFIEELFVTGYIRLAGTENPEPEMDKKIEKAPFRLCLLTPLGAR